MPRLLVALLLCTCASVMAQPYTPMRTAIHIHSQFSTGDESLAQIVEHGRQLGLDALVVTDDDLLQVSYGVPPWRRLLRVTEQYRSLLADDTLEDYLAELQRLDVLYEDIVLVDGVESAPYYRWEVDPGQRLWTLHGWNRHLLAVGLGEAEAYRNLPIIGGEGMLRPQGPDSMLRMLWPLLMLFVAVWFGRTVMGTGVRVGLGVVALLFLVDGALDGFRLPWFDAYHDAGSAPYQHFIDAVGAAGGLTYWSHPEGASTIPERSIAGVARVRSQTPPHGDDLLRTRRYTGFAALYADHITVTEPGHEWDTTLGQYLRGERATPVWGTGEIDYHRSVQGNRLHDIVTVLLVDERSRGGVLRALARGRGYAVRGGDQALRLAAWEVATPAGRAVAGQAIAAGASTTTVTVEIDKENGSSQEIDLRLVQGDGSGVRVVADLRGVTPLRMVHVAEESQDSYYRLLARSATSRLVSNPIFVRAGGR